MPGVMYMSVPLVRSEKEKNVWDRKLCAQKNRMEGKSKESLIAYCDLGIWKKGRIVRSLK